jgi:hypothetical protein
MYPHLKGKFTPKSKVLINSQPKNESTKVLKLNCLCILVKDKLVSASTIHVIPEDPYLRPWINRKK